MSQRTFRRLDGKGMQLESKSRCPFTKGAKRVQKDQGYAAACLAQRLRKGSSLGMALIALNGFEPVHKRTLIQDDIMHPS